MKNKTLREIIVCDTCGIPLIWTFKWDYYEYYCINCGGHWGMLGAGAVVEETQELKQQKKMLQKMFDKALGKYLLPRGQYKKTNCQKCDNENHNLHTSLSEKRKDKIATKTLKELQGCWIENEVKNLRYEK